MPRGSKIGWGLVIILLLGFSAPMLGMVSDPADNGPETSSSDTADGSSDGPQADTTSPIIHSITHTPLYPGPKTLTKVSGVVTDESTINVTLRYGYDNKTWSNISTSLEGFAPLTKTDRNPSSGTTRGTLSKTYTLAGTLMYLHVYCYSSDSDTLSVNIEGYNPSTSSWERIYYQYSYSPGTGTKVNQWLTSKGYSSWRISYSDYENNDNIYYNCTYLVRTPTYTGTLPAAGSNNWVYAYFNVTDASNNSADSNVLKWFIDRKKPTVKDVTTINFTRSRKPYFIYANVTDNNMIGIMYLNWSVDNSTFYLTFTRCRINCPTYINRSTVPYYLDFTG